MNPQFIIPVVAFFYPPLPAGFSLPAPTAEQTKLVQQLGSENFQERENAQEKLEKMDTEVFKALFEGATKDKDPEIRHRCSQILPKVMNYNLPKNANNLPTLFAVYKLNLTLPSGKSFYIDKDLFLKYFWLAIVNSDDSWRTNSRINLHYMTYLLPKASHYMFIDLRLMGYTRKDIDELINAMTKNMKKMNDTKSYEYYQWLN